jgi:predicted PurR-regulated permease PerM
MTTPEFKLPQLTVRQIVQAALLVVLVAAGFWFLYRFHQVFLTLFVALVLSTAIRPIARRLNNLGIPKEASVILIYLVVIVALVGIIVLLVPLVADQINRAVTSIPDVYSQIRESMLGNPNFFIWRLGLELPENITLSSPPPPVEDDEGLMVNVGQSLALLGLGVRTIFMTFAALVLAFYLTLEGQKSKLSLMLVVPLEHRESARELAAEIQDRLGAYVSGQVLLGLIIGGLSFIAYILIGLPNSLALALVAGIMEMVPIIGPFLGAIPALIVAYSINPTLALWVVVATIIIQQLENNLLVPRIMKKAVGVSPLVTLLALTAFGSLFGILGAVVAIPLAAIIQLLLDRFVLSPNSENGMVLDGRDRASLLQYEVHELVQDIRKLIRAKETEPDMADDEIEDNLEAIASNLESALAASLKKTREEKSNG